MEPDVIRAEIEQRKKRAVDLKIREVLWSLYHSHLSHYETLIQEDPELLCPEVCESIKISDKSVEFSLRQSIYRIVYTEGPKVRREAPGRGELFGESIVPAMLDLSVDDQRVLKFEIRRSTRYLDDGPAWNDDMGDITWFIEGLWVQELPELLKRIMAHEKSVRDRRSIPKLEAMKKRFGL
jgi:hypothetical protein